MPPQLSIDTPPRATAVLDVWYAWLLAGAAELDRLCAVLSEDERERAARFVFRRDRRRFIVARSLLRTILGRHLGCAPAELRFTYGPHGKPAVLGADTRFNLSHCEDLAVYVVTRRAEVGIDVERVRHRLATMDVAERVFSTAEVAALRGLAPRPRARAFFRCWTRTEAYLKARGDRLSVPLADFHVSRLAGDSLRLPRVAPTPREPSRWWTTTLYPLPGYVAGVAVAVGSRPPRVHCNWTSAVPLPNEGDHDDW